MKGQDKASGQTQDRGSNVADPKNNQFYALHSMGEQYSYPDMMTGMLQLFSIDVYDFLDPGATLSFVTPSVSLIFFLMFEIILLW